MYTIPVSPFTPHTSNKPIHVHPNSINHIKYQLDNVGVWIIIDRNKNKQQNKSTNNHIPTPDEFPDLNRHIRNPNPISAANLHNSSTSIYPRFKSKEQARNLIKNFGAPSNHHPHTKSDQKNLTSFLFFSFPDSWNSQKLWGIFKQYGDIHEVYIPRKTLKNGKRFGFVRFRNLPDNHVENMARKLNMIEADGTFLVVYKAHDRINASAPSTQPTGNIPNQHTSTPLNKFTDERKFSDVTAPYAQTVSSKSSC